MTAQLLRCSLSHVVTLVYCDWYIINTETTPSVFNAILTSDLRSLGRGYGKVNKSPQLGVYCTVCKPNVCSVLADFIATVVVVLQAFALLV